MSGPRNYGIDLLKILSMEMVVALHILGHGGILERSDPCTVKGSAVWLLEAALYCAVNNYALISGYVGYGKKSFRLDSLFHLCFQALFYRLCALALFLAFWPQALRGEDVLNALIPVRFGHWYLTAYFSMFFFTPALDRIVREFPRRSCEKLLFAAFAVCSLLPTLLHADIAHTNYGYSALWLALLYLAGAYLKKYRTAERMTKKEKNLCVGGYLLCAVSTWGTGLAAYTLSRRLLGRGLGMNILLLYTSPTVLGCALAMLLGFAGLRPRVPLRKFTGFFAPLSFGVYLIHTEPLLWNNLFPRSFASFAALRPWQLFPAVLGAASGIWLSCSLLDWLRLRLFLRLGIPALCGRLEDWVRRNLARLLPGLWGQDT